MEKTFSFRQSSIHYSIDGTGQPVLFIHGFGEDGEIWNGITASLLNNYTLVVPDLPGSGRSSLLSGNNENIGIEDYAGVIKAIIETENFTQVCIIGHSMGGYVALAFAEKYPEYLTGLGLFHSTAFADDDPKKEIRKKGINFVKNNGAQAFLQTTIPNMFATNFKNTGALVIDELLNKSKQFTDEAVIQYYFAMMNRKDRSDVLKNITVPVMFIIGEEDQAIPLNQSLKQTALPAKSYVRIMPGVGHMGMLENKNESLIFIKEFLDELHKPVL